MLLEQTGEAKYAEFNGGAIVATTGALELCKPYVTEGVYGMFGAYAEPGAAALIFGYTALPEGSNVAYNNDEIFNPASEVMSGTMTAQEWGGLLNQICEDIASGM